MHGRGPGARPSHRFAATGNGVRGTPGQVWGLNRTGELAFEICHEPSDPRGFGRLVFGLGFCYSLLMFKPSSIICLPVKRCIAAALS